MIMGDAGVVRPRMSCGATMMMLERTDGDGSSQLLTGGSMEEASTAIRRSSSCSSGYGGGVISSHRFCPEPIELDRF